MLTKENVQEFIEYVDGLPATRKSNTCFYVYVGDDEYEITETPFEADCSDDWYDEPILLPCFDGFSEIEAAYDEYCKVASSQGATSDWQYRRAEAGYCE